MRLEQIQTIGVGENAGKAICRVKYMPGNRDGIGKRW